MKSQYGSSSHYLGAKGQAYFATQNDGEELHGELNAWKFAPWIQRTDRVLDFGCGGGWLLKALGAANSVGVEVNPFAREICRLNGIEAYADIASVPAGMRFDKIISHHCLEHVPYPIAALRELAERLDPAGLLVVIVPIDDWRVQRSFPLNDIDHHLHTWTPRLFANTCREAGLDCRSIDILTHAWPKGWKKIHNRVPRCVYRGLCYLWSVTFRRRQLRAIIKHTDISKP